MEFNWVTMGAAAYLALFIVKFRIYNRMLKHFLYILSEQNPELYNKRFRFKPENTSFDDARVVKYLMGLMLFFGLPLVLVHERSKVFKEYSFDEIFHYVRRRLAPHGEPKGDGG